MEEDKCPLCDGQLISQAQTIKNGRIVAETVECEFCEQEFKIKVGEY